MDSPKPSLYVVSTPIGNLEDITLRALTVLREVSLIAAEDTRHTQKLLRHFKISTPMTSYHDHNKEEKTSVLLQRIREGQSIGLVTDAGTPGVSDPGFFLINHCIASGIPVVPVPGPAAFLAALAVSGLPTDAFLFEGFLPKKSTARIRRLESLKEESRTLIWYESPYRLERTISDIFKVFGDRRLVIARELTKRYEECLRGTASTLIELLKTRTLKGEITLVVEGSKKIPRLWE